MEIKSKQLQALQAETLNSLRGEVSNAERRMTAEQVAEAQRLAREFVPRKVPETDEAAPLSELIASRPSPA